MKSVLLLLAVSCAGLLAQSAAIPETTLPFAAHVAFEPEGRLVIATWFGPVYRLGPDGQLESAVKPGMPVFWSGLAVDRDGAIYLSDLASNRVWRYNRQSGLVPFAGSGGRGFTGDGGPVGDAWLDAPQGLAFHPSGDLLIADTGNLRIRLVHPDGIITTFAGSGQDERDRGDGGPAVNASLRPTVLAVDPAGNVYASDFPTWAGAVDYSGHRIRKISPDGAIATLLASSPGHPDVRMGISLAAPSADTVLYGDLYRIRRIDAAGVTTLAEGGPDADAPFYAPQGLAVAASGEIYVADILNARVRKLLYQ